MDDIRDVLSALEDYLNSTDDKSIMIDRNTLLAYLNILDKAKRCVMNIKQENEEFENKLSKVIVDLNDLEYNHNKLKYEFDKLQDFNSKLLDELEDKNTLLSEQNKELDKMSDMNYDLSYKLELLKKEINGDIF